jgi:hypothetical protein
MKYCAEYSCEINVQFFTLDYNLPTSYLQYCFMNKIIMKIYKRSLIVILSNHTSIYFIL